MLQLVLGLAGRGKTSHLIKRMNERAKKEEQSILLVPEQFSSAAEGLIYDELGEKGSAFVQVLSFRTLAERILKNSGGMSLPVMTDAGRVVFVKRALNEISQELRRFSRQRRSTAFCNLCAQTINELKTAGASPEVLRSVAAEAKDEKLAEIALIFEAYEAVIAGVCTDAQDRLHLASLRADGGFLHAKHCFVDSFDGFTSPEYEMLGKLLQFCEGVTVALCCEGIAENLSAPDRFSPVRSTANRLIQISTHVGIHILTPQILQKTLGVKSDKLLIMHDLLNGEIDADEVAEKMAAEENADFAQQLTLTKAQDEWDEVRRVAAKMYELALKGVPYSRMAVVCRDVAVYESEMRRRCSLLEIPLFVDAVSDIQYSAPVCFIRAALALLSNGVNSKDLLGLLKSGLCGYSEESIYSLENYVFTWRPLAQQWRTSFENNPDGLLAAQSAQSEHQLAMAEDLRAELVSIVEDFITKSRDGTAENLSKQLYLLLERFGAAQHLTQGAQRLSEGEYPAFRDDALRAWDLCMELLDEMVRLVGQEKLSATEYDELFLLLVRSTDFGKIPRTLECALLTGADRMRLSQPDYCFVLGLCEGEFPMQVGYSGLLTHLDRELLVQSGLEMPGSFENRVLLEEMFFYKALTMPKKGLHLSWPQNRAGEAKTRTAALQSLCEAIQMPQLCPSPEQIAATPAAAYELLGEEYRDNTPLAASLYEALKRQNGEEVHRLLGFLQAVQAKSSWEIADKSLVSGILGEEIYLSATTVERYYSCAFAYYMERILKAKPLPIAKVSPLEGGTFVHHILESVMRKAKQNLAEWTDEELSKEAQICADEFVQKHSLQRMRRDACRLVRIQQAAVKTLLFLRDAAKESDFVTDEVELTIGSTGEVEPLRIQLSDGRRAVLSGKVDRVDVLHKDGASWLCIMDYKTSDKRFELSDVHYGKNMQMLIYLDVLCENANGRYIEPKPVGVLYLCADSSPKSGTRTGAEGAVLRTDGILASVPGVLQSMEKSGAGVYIPVKYKKDGDFTATSGVTEEQTLQKVLRHVREKVRIMAENVYGGRFCAQPLVKKGQRPCTYCSYRAACRHEDGVNELEIQSKVQNAWDGQVKQDG